MWDHSEGITRYTFLEDKKETWPNELHNNFSLFVCPQVLDSKDLSIASVTHKEGGEALEYTLGDSFEFFGSRLEIKLPPNNEKK